MSELRSQRITRRVATRAICPRTMSSQRGIPRRLYRRRPRVPIETETRLDLHGLKRFLHGRSTNLSLGGMFLTSLRPYPVGTHFHFVLQPDDDFRVVYGRGTVVWTRNERGDRIAVPGMGIRFDELYGNSRKLLSKLIDQSPRLTSD